MNYNQGYAQSQQLPPLNYPIDAFVIQPQAVEPGRPPVMPNVPNLPPPIAQFYPFVVSACMDALMARARENPLRTYMYNQMSSNHWNNLDFPSFVDSVVRYMDMRLTKGEYPDIQSGAIKAAQEFAELTAAANVALNPQLGAYLNPQMLQGVQQVLAHLDRLRGEMQHFNNAKRQPGFGQQQQGFQQPPPMWNQPQQPPAWSQPQQHQAPAWSQPQQLAANPAWNQQPAMQPMQTPWRAQPHVTAVSAVSQTGPLFRTGNEQAPAATSQYADRYRDFTPPSTFASPAPVETSSTNAQNIQEMRRQKEQQMMSNVPTNDAPPTPPQALPVPEMNLVKASEHIVRWKPSNDNLINASFNPNTSDLYYDVQPDGTTHPKVKPKKESEMDLTKHFVPSYVATAPLGINALDTAVRGFEMDRALSIDAVGLEKVKPMPLNVAYKDETFHAACCVGELWFHNEVSLADMRKREDKVNLYRSCGLLLTPVISRKKNPKAFIDLLVNAESFAHACAILQTAHNRLNVGEHEHLEPKVLSFLNKRLTDHVNHFLKKKLASTVGWMDSFMEDAVKLVEFIESRCGEAMRKALATNQKTILKHALAYGDEEFEQEHNTFYLSEETMDELAGETGPKMTVTYFYTYYTLTSLDLFSVELNMELPDLEISAGVYASQTPLLRQIADNVFTHQKALDMVFGHHLLQTADGVCLELLQSPLNDEIYLVAAP